MTLLSDLLTPQTPETVFQMLLGIYQSYGFPVQSWQTGGVERTRLMAFATALADVAGNYIPAAAGGGFLDYATLPWLQLTAAELYNIAYNQPGSTLGNLTFTAAAGTGAFNALDGQAIAVFGASGRRYVNVGSMTLGAGPSVTVVPFRAEFTGAAYNDPSNSGAITLVTPIPGVTVTNPAGTFSAVAEVGGGTGTATPSGSPTAPHQVTVRVDSAGQVGVASCSYSLDGAPYVSVGVSNPFAIGSSGITVTLANGGSGTSFLVGDKFSFAAPGSWITTQGNDTETVTALAQRCRNRWATLSPLATNSFYQLLAQSTPGVGAQVTQALVATDAVVNDQVNIVVAGPLGALPPATVATIQAYVNSRVPLTDRPLVISPATLNVTLAAVVTCPAAVVAAAQGAIQVAMTNYVVGIGINGTIKIAAIIDLIMNALTSVGAASSACDVSGVTINGAAANLTLGSATSFVLPQLQPLSFSYVTA